MTKSGKRSEKMIKTDKVIYRTRTQEEYNWLMQELDEAGCVWLYGNSLVDYDEHWAYIAISRSCIGVVDCTIALPKMPLKDNEIYKECEIIDVSEIMESEEREND